MATTYKIGEAAALLNLKTYVLRFWETEFPQIAPLRTEKGQRLYTPGHLALLERIRFLLHERGLTIEGARKVLAEEAERGIAYTPLTIAADPAVDPVFSETPPPGVESSSVRPDPPDRPAALVPPPPVVDEPFLHTLVADLEETAALLRDTPTPRTRIQ